MKKVIIFPGLVPLEALEEFLENEKVDLKRIIIKKKLLGFYKRHKMSELLLAKESLLTTSDKGDLHYQDYTAAYESVISDARTFFIADRHFRKYGLNSSFNVSSMIESLVYNSLNILVKDRPEVVVFQATPHGAYTWVFAKVCEFLNIKVRFVGDSLVHWKVHPVEGIDEQRVIKRGEAELSFKKMEELINKSKGEYLDAMPSYEKERYNKNKGKYLTLRNELSLIFSKGFKHIPFQIIQSMIKFNTYRCYNKLVNNSFLGNGRKKIIVFMHYQPERTSIPEGGIYGQQLVIIRLLSMISKKYGFDVVVKEHPSMFRNHFDPDFRSRYDYKAISMMDNTYLTSLSMDSFSLIDISSLIVTITGTVALEALMRGKPALMFCNREITGLDGVYNANADNVGSIMDRVFVDGIDIDVEGVKKYLMELESMSFLRQNETNTSINAYKHAIYAN